MGRLSVGDSWPQGFTATSLGGSAVPRARSCPSKEVDSLSQDTFGETRRWTTARVCLLGTE